MADESVDEWLSTERDKRDCFIKARDELDEHRKADRVRDEAYRLAFARVWDIPKPLDDEAFRQWGERFAELGKIIAGHEGLANRLHGANLDGQNVALAGAVKLLQEATKGQTIAAHLRTFSLTPELQRFVEWLPFICDELCPPPSDESTLISQYYEPPGGCSRDDYKATPWLFNKRPVDIPETPDDGRTKGDEPASTSPAAPSSDAKPVDEVNDARHSIDFASVNWFGTPYTFTTNQAACVRVLWEAWKNKTPVLGGLTIIDAAGVDRSDERFDLVFRDNPAWGTMIVSPSKGRYCLKAPDAAT